MEQKNEPGRRPADKKNPAMGNNVIWYLLAIGIGTVFVVTFVANKPDVDLPYSELVRLIELGSDEKNLSDGKPPAHIDVREGTESAPRIRRYSGLTGLKVGVAEVTGQVKITQVQPPDTAGSGEQTAHFRTGRIRTTCCARSASAVADRWPYLLASRCWAHWAATRSWDR